MRKIKGDAPIPVLVGVVIAIAGAIILITVIAPAIQNASPDAFLPENLVGGQEKDAIS